MIKKIVITLSLFVFSVSFFAQTDINQFDANGERHGVWLKKYNNGNIRYKGTFEHGVEVGEFKFYAISGEKYPVVTKEFISGSDLVKVKFFTKENGKLKSEGNMQDKLRTGLWSFYLGDGKTLLLTEEYKEGELHGEQKVFYKTGKLTKHAHYKNGKLDGVRKIYSKEGEIIEELTYKDGVMHGAAVIYDKNAVLFAKGNYTNGFRTGTWEFMIDGQMIKTDNPYVIKTKLENTLKRPIRHNKDVPPEKVFLDQK